MWRNVKISWSDIDTTENFILKSLNKSNNFALLVSDFQNIWSENLSTELLCSRCKELNPLVEATDEHLYQQVVSLVDGSKNSVLTVKCRPEDIDTLYLHTECKLSGVSFVYEFQLKLADRSIFYKELTTPLALMVLELQARQQQLYSILKKKDAEIAEYKLNGAQLSRKNIETAVFDECDFEFSRYLLEVPTNPTEKIFEHKTKNLYLEVTRRFEEQKIKKETAPITIKQENENLSVAAHTSNGTAETTSESSPNKRTATGDSQNVLENVKQENTNSQEHEKKVLPQNVPAKKPKKDTRKKLGL